MSKILLGADPELFFVDAKTGKFISAIGLVPGTKWEPTPVPKLGEGFAIQQDNVAAEFNIPACDTPEQAAEAIAVMLDYLDTEYAKPNGLKISTVASAVFDQDQLDNPIAQVFGCDPDFDVYTLEANAKPKARNKNLRSAGGHIHMGHEHVEIGNEVNICKLSDLHISLPLLFLDKDTKRRKLYGSSGAARFKNYGVEYRTPSNFWIFNPEIRLKTLQRAFNVVDQVESNGGDERHIKLAMLARAAINTNDKRLAKEICDELALYY